ncbi:MAG: bifunctional (p)ppGpp synthetase/guanosine-3',5'-bis(diphosphate) 3'-pyrophosphohydrolase, partial [Gammaproteobacteria bacterium]|nr:bifunctional (p)ppGpp synthetase/guanosine-3',5'-bis(diphosphate) 3'-pyrophosphohydrolase [Gammaproteobacteria bacterium]
MKTGIADPSEGSNQEELIREITAGQSVEASRLIRRAWEVKKQATAAGNAGDGAGDYLRVVHILRTLNMDREIIAAAMLYDLMADDRFHPDEIRSEFGESVAHLAEGLTRMSRIGELRGDESDLEERPARLEGLRKLLLAMAEDLRVVIVKLAERLHGMRTLIRKKDDVWRRRVAAETLEIYAPLANRLGIWHIKWELEDLAFRCLEPMRYREIAANLDERRQDRELFISEVVSTLLTELAAQGIRAEVNGRPKHIYSIWKKMKRKGLAFNELYDVRAVRILTESVGDCYAVLGVVHGLWPHLPREFDDYITNPKGNSYRSLHTAVIGPGGRTLEVQIRTQEMHRHAEMGVAAHWRYKEGGKQEHSYDSKIAWLRQILQLNDEPGDDDDFLERFKTEVFQDRVYALSPRGRVVDLPRGATPLDFAYTIHSEVGNRCRGAKVDDSIVPLTYELQNGDQVEILTARNGTPSRDWLNSSLGYLKTSRARSKVRQWFKQQDLEINLAEGRDLLDRELRRLGVTDVNLDRLARRLKYPRLDGLLSAIGRGEVSSAQIAGAVREQLLPRDVSVPEMVKPPVRET